ncbi:MAG: FliH/SctL family protein [Alphaproteobacteria bacterium]|nr:FliH/SctL family protein [Alphaproteobacteria bacterium]
MARENMQPNRPTKFNFDTVFGTNGSPATSHVRSTYSSDEVEAIRSETFALGKADTEAQAAAARAATLAAIAESLMRMIGEFDAVVKAMRQDSAAIAIEVGRKLAEVALDAFPLKEVEMLLADCLHKLHREPRIVVRLAPDNAEALRADIDALCHQHAFAGRIVIIAEPALTGSDCRIEWADGGVERDLATTFSAIEQGAERWRSSNPTEES